MDTLASYQATIKAVLSEQAQYQPSHGTIEPMLLFDDTNSQYQLLFTGWDRTGRVHGTAVHIRLHNGKIWIEHDGTEEGVATALVAAGIPKDAIVLAWMPERDRAHTEFAVA
ncbi:MAG: XisI protein [Chloroflexaceae bacterium]|jgi:hypothetical protein|nr:XisI protein [Chloroflexaceae bacterium]